MNTDKKLEELQRRIEKLEEQIEKLDPWKDFRWVEPNRIPSEPSEVEAGCAVCGMKFKGPCSYVCNNPKCPGRVTYE